MNFRSFQKIIKIWLTLIIGQVFLLSVFAQEKTAIDPLNLPKVTEFITDFSSILSVEQLAELRTLAKEYETKTSTQIVTVLFPHRQWNELFEIGMKVFRDNNIGQKDKNNGLLLLIATDEKKIRIIVGYGLEGSMPDGLASNIIEDNIRPRVNSWDFYQAVKNFYERTIPALDTFEGKSYTSPKSNETTNIFIVIIALFLGSFIGSKVWDRSNGTHNDHLHKKRIQKRRWLWLLTNILIFGWFVAAWIISSIILVFVIIFSVGFFISFLSAYFWVITWDYFGGSGRWGWGWRSGGWWFGGGSFGGWWWDSWGGWAWD